MSSETDQPRQRTVAELLAAHGGQAAAPGRRRRRREADETSGDLHAGGAPAPLQPSSTAPPPVPRTPRGGSPAGPAPQVTAPRSAPPQAGSRPVLRAQANGAPQSGLWGPASPHQGIAANGSGPARENPTDVIPRVREPQPIEDLTPPGRMSRRDRFDAPADDEGGPSTMVGLAPAGAEDWHAARTGPRRGGTAIDGGPPMPAGPVAVDEGPAGLGGPVDLGKHDDDAYDDAYDDDTGSDSDGDAGRAPQRERRLGRSARETVSTAWSTVLVQWLAGALGGAVLWVGFRFLWRSLPVVAGAAALAVTVGLVLVVRALLHNDDRRTTVFAVLVGILLTVSPAILVVLGR